MKQEIETNYRQIKKDIVQVIEAELERIKSDPELRYLLKSEKWKHCNTNKQASFNSEASLPQSELM